jgi:hypothetical protein
MWWHVRAKVGVAQLGCCGGKSRLWVRCNSNEEAGDGCEMCAAMRDRRPRTRSEHADPLETLVDGLIAERAEAATVSRPCPVETAPVAKPLGRAPTKQKTFFAAVVQPSTPQGTMQSALAMAARPTPVLAPARPRPAKLSRNAPTRPTATQEVRWQCEVQGPAMVQQLRQGQARHQHVNCTPCTPFDPC